MLAKCKKPVLLERSDGMHRETQGHKKQRLEARFESMDEVVSQEGRTSDMDRMALD